MSEQLPLIAVSATINAICGAIGIYIGFTRGTDKMIDIVLDKLEKRMSKSPTMIRLTKLMETSDKLFGDEQAVEQMTKFFKEATDLVSSPEAKSLCANLTKLIADLSSESSNVDVKIKLPEKKLEKTKC